MEAPGALTDSGDSGRFGRHGLVFLALFGVALPLLAPLVDIMLVYGLVFWDRSQTVVAWFAMLALQLITAVVAFRFDRESLRPLLKLPLQQFAYRQLMYLVLIQSAVTALTGGRLRWHKLHRAGLAVPADDLRPAAVPAGAVLTPTRVTAIGRATPGTSVAPAVDTWPPVLDQQGRPGQARPAGQVGTAGQVGPASPANGHPAAGRAGARPAVPTQPRAGAGGGTEDAEPVVLTHPHQS